MAEPIAGHVTIGVAQARLAGCVVTGRAAGGAIRGERGPAMRAAAAAGGVGRLRAVGVAPAGGSRLGEAQALDRLQPGRRRAALDERVESEQQIIRTQVVSPSVLADLLDEGRVDPETAGPLVLRVRLDQEPATLGNETPG